MKRPAMFGWLLLALMTPGTGAAHDLGVTQATLAERADASYELRVTIAPNRTALVAAPRLPSRCKFVDHPSGRRAGDGLVYEFACQDSALSANDTIELPWRREGAMLSATWSNGAKGRRFFPREGKTITVDLSLLQAGSGTTLDAASRYTWLGIEHIAGGTDHLLFILGLLLMVEGATKLLQTITAFTIAHSITLALATLGFVHFSPAPVEAAIALSIAFLAAEIVRHHRSRTKSLGYRFPWGLAFAFGLLHGLGFSGALSELGLASSEIPLALLFFNVGVEIGQLAFVGVLVLARVALNRMTVAHFERLDPALAYGIGGLAMYWFLQRTLAIVTPVFSS